MIFFWILYSGIILNLIFSLIAHLISRFSNIKLHFIKYLLYSSLYITLFCILFSLIASTNELESNPKWGFYIFLLGLIGINFLAFIQFKETEN